LCWFLAWNGAAQATAAMAAASRPRSACLHRPRGALPLRLRVAWSAGAVALLGALVGPAIADAQAALPAVARTGAARPDPFAIAITGWGAQDALWPIELRVELHASARVDAAPLGRAPIAPQVWVVRDGAAIQVEGSVAAPRGQHRFELSVVPRRHPGGRVELQWSLRAFERTYGDAREERDAADVWDYVQHRLQLAPLRLGPERLRGAWADLTVVVGHAPGLRADTSPAPAAAPDRLTEAAPDAAPVPAAALRVPLSLDGVTYELHVVAATASP
jgi:hypothetical protein